MSIDGAPDHNVFFSSSRVSFGEPPLETTTTTPLLTFADMVLALERQNISETFECRASVVDVNVESDHTYASSGCSRTTTRSQTAKAAAHLTSRFLEPEDNKWKIKDEDFETISGDANLAAQTETLSSKYVPHSTEPDSLLLKGKRCSSLENIYSAETELTVNVSRNCEWPEALPKSSPRKSSSFEEVSCDNSKSCLKSSKSSEHVQRTGISYTLHRFVNNTLEFPCWPRKADHTYATATWDGTAASHSLFEQELRQDSTIQNIIEDQEMEDIDNDYMLQNQCDQSSVTSDHHNLQNFPFPLQKDDHTYVKSKFSQFGSQVNTDTEVFNLPTDNSTLKRQTYLSATFPRQKMREDHTYFHSGLSRRSSSGSGGRDWVSTQTVASASVPHDLQVEEAYRNLNSFSQSASAKKDHNYSTSA